MWPFSSRSEKRSSVGDAVTSWALSQASVKAANSGSTAAIECAAGLLSRSLADAEVVGESWVQDALNPAVRAQMGRSLIRDGSSMSLIQSDMTGIILLPVSSWTPAGGDKPSTWIFTVHVNGPTSMRTLTLPGAGLLFLRWGSSASAPYAARGPVSWASTTAKMSAETERSIGDEASGPIATLIPLPESGMGSGDIDPTADIRKKIANARGDAVTLPTTRQGWAEGAAAAPARDWAGNNRLGPNWPASMATIQAQAFAHMLGSCGIPPDLFSPGSNSQGQKEALRRYHLSTVIPLSKQIAYEATMKLETSVSFRFDCYPKDMTGRATSFQKLVAGGMELERAAALSGVLADDNDDD